MAPSYQKIQIAVYVLAAVGAAGFEDGTSLLQVRVEQVPEVVVPQSESLDSELFTEEEKGVEQMGSQMEGVQHPHVQARKERRAKLRAAEKERTEEDRVQDRKERTAKFTAEKERTEERSAKHSLEKEHTDADHVLTRMERRKQHRAEKKRTEEKREEKHEEKHKERTDEDHVQTRMERLKQHRAEKKLTEEQHDEKHEEDHAQDRKERRAAKHDEKQQADSSNQLPPGNVANGEHPGRHHCFERAVKEQSMVEESKTCRDISIYGAHVPKVPRSTVEKVLALSKEKESEATSNKTCLYNFQGSLVSRHDRVGKAKRRQWVVDFVKHNFKSDDIFITTHHGDHSPIGEKAAPPPPSDVHNRYFRQSLLGEDISAVHNPDFDERYYMNMAQCKFTLCPGGDLPWSMRFYEAILAGSIPVIDNVDEDIADSNIGFWFAHIGYKFFTPSQLRQMDMSDADLRTIASENRELFLKYQTWIHGDHVPSEYAAYSSPCSSDSTCNHRCVTEHSCTSD